MVTVSLQIILPIIRYLKAAGKDIDSILTRIGLDRETLKSPDKRISGLITDKLLREAIKATQDEAFGLHLAESKTDKELGLLDYILRSSRSLGHSFEQAQRYFRLNGDEPRIEFKKRQKDAILFITFNPSIANYTRAIPEMILASFVSGCRRLINSNLNLTEVHFTHPSPSDLKEHRRIFQAPLFFSQPQNALVFPLEDLDLQFQTHDSGLSVYLERHAEEILSRVPQPSDSLLYKAKKIICTALAEDKIRAQDIAKSLNISERTMHRRFKEKGVTFSTIVDQVRHELAISYLSDRSYGIDEIAYQLGYSETSAFSRAFRRWTGHSPAAHRATLLQMIKP